jgi:hypothetical protein
MKSLCASIVKEETVGGESLSMDCVMWTMRGRGHVRKQQVMGERDDMTDVNVESVRSCCKVVEVSLREFCRKRMCEGWEMAGVGSTRWNRRRTLLEAPTVV